MYKLDLVSDSQYIFGSLLTISSKLDTLLERELREFGVTSKQWLVFLVIESLYDNPPTINEVAKTIGSSHQNIKQIALKLEEKGLLNRKKDLKDRRVTRLEITDKSNEFWSSTRPKGNQFIKNVFENISSDELYTVRVVMQKLLDNLTYLDD